MGQIGGFRKEEGKGGEGKKFAARREERRSVAVLHVSRGGRKNTTWPPPPPPPPRDLSPLKGGMVEKEEGLPKLFPPPV